MHSKFYLTGAAVVMSLSTPANAQHVSNQGRYIFVNHSASNYPLGSGSVRSKVQFLDTQTGRFRECDVQFADYRKDDPPIGKRCVWDDVAPAYKLPGGTTYSWATQGTTQLFKQQWAGISWAIDDKTGKAYACLNLSATAPVKVRCFLVG